MIKDLTRYVMNNLAHRKLRSFLSVLSILIGIMAIYAILSFGQGLQSYIGSIAEKMGTDKIIIQQRGFSGPEASSTKFSNDDIGFVKRVQGVGEAAGIAADVAQVKYKNERARVVTVIAYEQDKTARLIEETMTLEIEEGRMLKNGDTTKVVLGYSYSQKNKLFKRPVSVGDRIILNGKGFEVVGMAKEIGNPNDDRQVYLTMDGLALLKGAKEDFALVIVKASPGQDPTALADKITEKFRRHRGEKKGEETFYVQTFQDLIKTFSAIITGLNAVLFVIALISVVVAAVNIMNTMYTAVLERTREIGIFKAVGARNSAIFFIFVLESGLLGLFGGIIGVLLGHMIASAGGAIAAAGGFALLRPAFPWWLTTGCLVFSFLVGAASGLNPAIGASKQKPVDALRYE